QLLGGVHMVLMGDPSLRLHMVYPVTNLTATQTETSIQLNWTASIDNNILGYNVYRADTMVGNFVRLNPSVIAAAQYIDSFPSLLTNNVYMVRAVKSETTPSGSYQNMSEGIFITKPVVTTFTFSGNGAWSISGNWINSLKPPSTLPIGYTIVIDPVPGGECLLDSMQHISTGAHFSIAPGKNFRIADGLFLH
ncbi:MAG: fibronectin type III domain-containing protein, partial [Saprospiraceae bacterium]